MLKKLVPIVAVYLSCSFAALPALASLPGTVCPSPHTMVQHKTCRMMGPACPMKKHGKGLMRACPLKADGSQEVCVLACDCGGDAPHAMATVGPFHQGLLTPSPRFSIQVFQNDSLLPPKEFAPSGFPDGLEHPPQYPSL